MLTSTMSGQPRGHCPNNWIPFEKNFWQRNYYETIIRDELSLGQIRQYIIQNPLRWELELHHQQKYHSKPTLSEQFFPACPYQYTKIIHESRRI